MNSSNTTRLAALLALCGAFGASTVLAQSEKAEGQSELKGSYDKPLPKKTKRSKSDNGASVNKMTMITSEGDQTYSVTVDNGEVSASINGEEVPQDRIKKTDDKVVLLDKDGKELKSFNISSNGVWSGHMDALHGGEGWLRLQNLGQDQPRADKNIKADKEKAWRDGAQKAPAAPPVMVGITMSDPDPSLLEHLGVDADAAFMIDRVVDGLPADKAGVKVRDIVVALDGQKPATQEKFRELLRTKKAGDNIEFTVVRKGKEEHVKIELVAYNREKLGVPGENTLSVVPRLRDNGLLELGVEGPGGGKWTDEARIAIEKALKEIKDNPDLQPEKIKAQAERALQEALAAIQEGKDVFVRRFNNWQGGGDKPDLLFSREGQAFAVPAPMAENNPEMTRRLERLTDQLERLNRRLDEMERRMQVEDKR